MFDKISGQDPYEGFGIGVLDKKKDSVCVNADMRIMEAKKKALELSDLGYVWIFSQTSPHLYGRLGQPSLIDMLYRGKRNGFYIECKLTKLHKNLS